MSEKKVEHYIREWRQTTELTQAEFARAVGMSPSNYHQLETGSTGYTQSNLGKISQYLKVSPAALISVNPLDNQKNVDDEPSILEEVKGVLAAMEPVTRSLAVSLLKASLQHEKLLKKMNEPGINLTRLNVAKKYRL